MDQYRVLELVGKGSFGIVQKIQRRSDGRILVWKELNYGSMSDKEKQLVVSEVNILRELRHPHILRYYDRIIDKPTTKLYVITEFCEGGDLGALVKRYRAKNGRLDEQRIWKYFAQITMALTACHRRMEKGKNKPILHRDIKPANIFLDRNGNIKMGDYGLARELDSQSKFARTNVGTPYYMSPEQTNSLKYDERSDIWAVGCVLYELAALRPPFQARNQVALAMKINAGHFDRIPSNYSEDLHRTIRWMLHINLLKRPRVEECAAIPQVARYMATTAPKACAMAPPAPKAAAEAMPPPAPKPTSSKEHQLAEKEKQLRREADRLKALEKTLNEREQKIREMERECARKQTDLTIRETRLETAEMEARLKRRTSAPSVASTYKGAPSLERQYSWNGPTVAPLGNATNTTGSTHYQLNTAFKKNMNIVDSTTDLQQVRH
jgi:NIMA (never in mitosis gene a)-related kinase 2